MIDEQMKAKVERFAEIVHRYCVWVESPSVDANADMQTAQKLLAELQFLCWICPMMSLKMRMLNLKTLRLSNGTMSKQVCKFTGRRLLDSF
ncbi:MAG: hypothetical protein IPK58_24860 [Acidobacteria bacterium]|nr:hypothetical protein [Acidobacteriota bacterium]